MAVSRRAAADPPATWTLAASTNGCRIWWPWIPGPTTKRNGRHSRRSTGRLVSW